MAHLFFGGFYLAYRLFKPIKIKKKEKENFKVALILAIPISILSGFLGVGPGFLLLPTLILTGFKYKKAAATNAFAVCPPSFLALIPHLKMNYWNLHLTFILIGVSLVFSYLGARTTALYIPSKIIKKIFRHFNYNSNCL